MRARRLTVLSGATAGSVDRSRCLYTREELPAVLKLSSAQVSALIDTGQLTALLICGEERFDSVEVSALIDTYLRVTRRRTNDRL